MWHPNYKPLWWILKFYGGRDKRMLFSEYEEIEEFLKKKYKKLILNGDYISSEKGINDKGFIDWAIEDKNLVNALKRQGLKEDERKLLIKKWGLEKNAHKILDEQLIKAIGLDEFRRSIYLANLKSKYYE